MLIRIPAFVLSLTATAFVFGISAAHAAGDAAAGEKVFRLRCAFCHAATATDPGGKQGPTLFGVIGRKAASVDGFEYSDAMKSSGITWTADALKPYASAPTMVVPGGKMTQPGPTNPQQLDDLVAYLTTLK